MRRPTPRVPAVLRTALQRVPLERVPPWAWRPLGVVVLLAAAWPSLQHYLIVFPDEIWEVDLEVYREGAHSLLLGRPVYDWLTENPQYLPFTYPPFAALLGLPLVLVPFGAVGWLWSAVQLWLLWVCTGVACRPLLERCSAVRRPFLHGVLAAVLMQLQPVQDGIRFGQVNAVLVALCLVDLGRERAGWWPRGSLSGIATAIKLTPGVFWVHYAITRRWRTLAWSVGTAAGVTVATLLLAPAATAVYWTDALLDPERLGPNDDTSNQSLRGMLLRIGPTDTGLQDLVWAGLALLVMVVGFWVSARLHRLGEQVAVVAVLGMVAVLVSPVSWTHHLYWGVAVVGALLGDGRGRLRVVLATLAWWVLWAQPYSAGAAWVQRSGGWHALGLVAQQGYCWFAMAAIVAIGLSMAGRRRTVRAAAEPVPDGAGHAG